MKRGRKWIALLAAVLLVTPLAVWASDRFEDVPDDNVFHDDISWLADSGVTFGCNPPANTQFCPDDNVTREQMAAFIRRLSEGQIVDAATALEADHATSADSAAAADHATTADSAAEANHASEADHAAAADHATTADSAAEADHASEADHAAAADTAANADTLDGLDSTAFAMHWLIINPGGSVRSASPGLEDTEIFRPPSTPTGIYCLVFPDDVSIERDGIVATIEDGVSGVQDYGIAVNSTINTLCSEGGASWDIAVTTTRTTATGPELVNSVSRLLIPPRR